MDNFTTLLIFPPQWSPQNPFYAITCIAGHMRSKGYNVVLRDLNVEFYDEALTPEYMDLSKKRIELEHNYLLPHCTLQRLIGEDSVDLKIKMMKLQEIERFLKEERKTYDGIQNRVLDARETFRDRRRFYNPVLLVDAFFTIDKALEIISLPFHPARISFYNFEQPHCLFATHSLMVHSKSRELNMFYDYFLQKMPGLLKVSPQMIAISINSFSQILPGLTLAMMLKKEAPPGCLINIGGNFFTRVRDTLMKRPEFFQSFTHTVTMGEGEKQTTQLVDEWKGSKDLSKVPNILYYDEAGGQVRYSFDEEPEKLNNLGFQDFEGLPLKKYFTPEIVASVQSSKGCYWGKCTFCDSDYGIKRDVKSHDRLVEEIMHLKKKFGIRHFEFTDESLRPEYMETMARRFIDERLDIFWFSNGRTEAGFTPELLRLLHESGCTMILWGFESGNERIMKLINKGIGISERYEILKSSDRSGIWNFAYVFFGFPTETEEEARDTIRAICANKDIIHSYGRSVFTLGKHSMLLEESSKYGIFDIREEGEELSSNISYKCSQGMTAKDTDALMKECTRTCATAYDYTLWYYLRYRENIHLYLVRFGKEYVKSFKVKEALAAFKEAW